MNANWTPIQVQSFDNFFCYKCLKAIALLDYTTHDCYLLCHKSFRDVLFHTCHLIWGQERRISDPLVHGITQISTQFNTSLTWAFTINLDRSALMMSNIVLLYKNLIKNTHIHVESCGTYISAINAALNH